MADQAGRELLLAGVVARLTWLRHADVLHAPCSPLDGCQTQPGSPAALLWAWSRLLSDIQQLLTRALEPALREPGRIHQRQVSIERGRPRGAVQWPRTGQLALRTVDARGLRYVCSSAERSLLAPENLLLVATLDELLERGLLLGEHEGIREQLGAVGLDPLRRARAHLRTAASTPAFTAWRGELSARRRQGRAVVGELERAVSRRVQGRPSAAPDWARALLELRRRPAVPSRAALERIEPGGLWRQFAVLELLCALRGRGVLRQHEWGFSGPGGLALRRIEGSPAWVVAVEGREPVGLLWPASETWEQVRREALYWSWTARHQGVDIDRWLIFHRTQEATLTRTRGAIELRYCPLPADSGFGRGTRAELLDWMMAG